MSVAKTELQKHHSSTHFKDYLIIAPYLTRTVTCNHVLSVKQIPCHNFQSS